MVKCLNIYCNCTTTDQVVTVKFLKEKCKLQSYSEDELFRAIGIFLTNGVNQGIFNSQGLYPTFSFISHRCT